MSEGASLRGRRRSSARQEDTVSCLLLIECAAAVASGRTVSFVHYVVATLWFVAGGASQVQIRQEQGRGWRGMPLCLVRQGCASGDRTRSRVDALAHC